MSQIAVRTEVARYLAGMITAEELERGLPDGWELDETGDDELRRVTLVVMGRLAEYFEGDLAEPDLRRTLEEHAAWRTSISYAARTHETIARARPETAESFAGGTSLLVGSA